MFQVKRFVFFFVRFDVYSSLVQGNCNNVICIRYNKMNDTTMYRIKITSYLSTIPWLFET